MLNHPDGPLWMMFHGRKIIVCAVVAGGSKGGVNQTNIKKVQIEVERYMDSDEYVLGGDGHRTISDDDWKPKAPIYQFTDWHNSRTQHEFLEEQVRRMHLMCGK